MFFRMQYADHEPSCHGEPLNTITTAISNPYILTNEGLQMSSRLVPFIPIRRRPG